MPTKKVFLRAAWRNLLIANYTCHPDILQKYLPAKTYLDTYNGEHLVSLVAFQFLDTTVKGIKFPGHVNFVEINLRFYVKHKDGEEWKRGVVFIKEIVPKHLITFVANTLFNENYVTQPTNGIITTETDVMQVNYTWGKASAFSALAQKQPVYMQKDSLAEFITEHYWGYAAIDNNTTNQYAVEHPSWRIHPIQTYNLQTNFAQVYGDDFAYLNDVTPHSVLLAEGSKIIVRNGSPIV